MDFEKEEKVLEKINKTLESPNLVKTGFMTGRQQLITPSDASRHVSRAIEE